jgi:hypothetical protein
VLYEAFKFGINDRTTKGVYRNYKTGRSIGHLLTWFPGEPNDGAEHCVESGDGYNDNDCDAYRHVGCEMKY